MSSRSRAPPACWPDDGGVLGGDEAHDPSGQQRLGQDDDRLRLRALVPDLVIVSQDVVRHEILGTRDVADNPSIGLIDLVARYALGRGRHVIVEGALHAPRYGAMLRSLVADHQGVSRAYVMDVPFEETLRRHATKAEADEFRCSVDQPFIRTIPASVTTVARATR